MFMQMNEQLNRPVIKKSMKLDTPYVCILN